MGEEADGGLEAYRRRIDALDDELLALLEARAGLAREVGEIKRRAGMRVFSVAEREAQVVRRLREAGGVMAPHVAAIYREIMSACLACEKPAAVAYFGPAGTWTHEAALKMFGHAAVLHPMPTIEATVGEAEKEQCDFAVVPFENSSAGTVGVTVDVLARTPLSINGEVMVRVRHNLLCADEAAPERLTTIYAHPLAFEQCRRWLDANAPQATRLAAESNAAATRTVAEMRGGVAAIGSLAARDIYELTLVAADIADFDNNSTRFLVLGRRAPAPSGDDKTSFIMTVKDAPGAMFEVFQPLRREGVNMEKLESRPIPGRLWEYLFFVDCAGHRDDPALVAALAGVRELAASMNILGSYPRAGA